MIELILAIIVVVLMAKFAREANQSGLAWGGISALAYLLTFMFVSPEWAYARVLAVGFLLVVALMMTRIIRKE